MTNTMHLTPEENEIYLAAFTAELNARHHYQAAKLAGENAVEALRSERNTQAWQDAAADGFQRVYGSEGQ